MSLISSKDLFNGHKWLYIHSRNPVRVLRQKNLSSLAAHYAFQYYYSQPHCKAAPFLSLKFIFIPSIFFWPSPLPTHLSTTHRTSGQNHYMAKNPSKEHQSAVREAKFPGCFSIQVSLQEPCNAI